MIKKLLIIKSLNNGLRTIDLVTEEFLSLKTDIYSYRKKISELDTISFDVEKEWTFKKQKYAVGSIKNNELILSNIHVNKIEYESMGIWDPHESYGDETEKYFSEYIKEGYREAFILNDYTGYGFYNKDDDPIYEAVELKESGDWKGAYNKLTKLWEDYPECIDALVHVGNLYFDYDNEIERSLNCYTVAVNIVDRYLPKAFDGIFLWECLENRPYLRALQGLCLILWKMKAFDKAFVIAEKMLRLCPSDNLGIRFIIDPIKNHNEWHLDY